MVNGASGGLFTFSVYDGASNSYSHLGFRLAKYDL